LVTIVRLFTPKKIIFQTDPQFALDVVNLKRM